jgi:hypothetical protein
MTWDHISAIIAVHATMTSDRISATMTYVMREEYFWYVSILQRVHLSNFV